MSILNKNTCPRGGVASHRRKHGFTITELVIVIAVIAILAAVLIPTFANLINKANESADLQTVKNLNTILASEQTVSQKKPATMSEALAQAAEGGYTVEKLSPTSEDNDILWNQTTNRFVLVDKDGKIIYQDESVKEVAFNENDNYTYWKIADSESEIASETKGYSFYLSEDFDNDISLNATAGIDVGTRTGIDIFYTSKAQKDEDGRTVLFNTNGGTLTIDGQYDTVYHYNNAELVEIKNIDNNSYHLVNGTVNNLKAAKGHIVIEKGGNVGQLTITASKAEDISVNVNVGATVAVAGAENEEVAKALDKIITAAEGTVEEIYDSVLAENTTDFGGGYGTQASPYLIGNLQQLKNIAKLSSEMRSGTAYYFKQTADIEITGDKSDYKLSNGDFAVVEHFRGGYDGNGYKFSSEVVVTGSTTWFALFYNTYASEIKNIELYLGDYWFHISAYTKGGSSSVVIYDNINTYNAGATAFKFPGNNYGALVSYPETAAEIKNCTNRANFEGNNAGSAVWVGTPDFQYKLTYINCANYGDVYGSGGLFGGNSGGSTYISHVSLIEQNLIIENCYNYGDIIGDNVGILGWTVSRATENGNIYPAKVYQDKLMATGNFGNVVTMAATKSLLTKDTTTNQLTISSVANAARYELAISGYFYSTPNMDKNGGQGTFRITVDFDKAGKIPYYYCRFIDSVTAEKNSSLVKDGEKLYQEGEECETSDGLTYYIYTAKENGKNVTYYVFEDFVQLGTAAYIDVQASYSIMVYNEANQLIAYSRQVA